MKQAGIGSQVASESSRKLFGTDGIRGLANEYPMRGEVMLELGRALAMVFQLGPAQVREHRVLIAKDTRRSGYMLEDALAAGICSMGVNVLQVGPMPTPGLAFLTADMRCDAGAMISASHNSFEDNGIKFFSGDGLKLPDATEARIESLMFSEELRRERPVGADIGRARRIDDASGRYIVFLKKTFPEEFDLEGLRIAIDCANGAAYHVAPTVLEELGAEVIPIGTSPDGTNINLECGALYPEKMAEAVRASRADVGIALDGDADRAILCDGTGAIVDGDHVLAMLGIDLHKNGRLEQAMVVGTHYSNAGLEIALERHGIRFVRAPVGDRYVLEAMQREGANLGGEKSGHIILRDWISTGDGMLTGLQVLALMRRTGRSLEELGTAMEQLPQVLEGIRVREKPPIESLAGVSKTIKRLESSLEGRGRILVRYSGTELLVRVMVEGENQAQITKVAAEISAEIEKAIGEVGPS